MKRIFFSAAAIFMIFPALSEAQDLPVPAQEQAVETVKPAAITEETAVETTETPVQAPEKTAEMKAAEELMTFFNGLEQAVDAAEGDCQKISDAMSIYYESHKGWISGLDYSVTNVDEQTIETLHQKAVEFGKKLSACYDQESIPEQLHRYAGLGEEW